MRGLVGAASLLTRAPVVGGGDPAGRLGLAVPWFPVVGAGIGALVGAIVLAGRGWGMPAYVAAGVAVTASVLITGALHEDGLADTFDGLGSGRSGREAVEVMRDPRVGVFGGSALALSLLLQVLTLGSLPLSALFGVAVAAHAASRGFAAVSFYLPSAADTGLGATYAQESHRWAPAAGFAVGLAIALLVMRDGAWVLLPAMAVWAAMSLWACRRLGGITGDVIGALQQVTLLTILVGATVA